MTKTTKFRQWLAKAIWVEEEKPVQVPLVWESEGIKTARYDRAQEWHKRQAEKIQMGLING